MDAGARLRTWARDYGIVAVLAIPLMLLALAVDLFGGVVSGRIVTVMFINMALVLGLQMFTGNSGVVSFGHIAFMGIGAYASALFSMSPQAKAIALRDLYPILAEVQLPFIVALLIGAGIATVVGAVIGFPLMRLSGGAAVIATFALLVITRVILVNWSAVTNGPRTLFGLERHTTLWVSVAWTVLFICLAYWFRETSRGLKLRASREDEQAAAAVGINIVNMRWVAFVLSVFVTGVAGVLWAHFITSFSPDAFYLRQTFLIIAMLIIGGSASVTGAVAGTVLVTATFEGLRAIENAINLAGVFSFTVSGLTEVCLATAMILVLVFRPAGVTGGQELRWPIRQVEPEAPPGAADQRT